MSRQTPFVYKSRKGCATYWFENGDDDGLRYVIVDVQDEGYDVRGIQKREAYGGDAVADVGVAHC